MANKAVKLTRSKRFTAEEVAVLVEEVDKRRGLLFGPVKGPNLTHQQRDRAWQQVTAAVNAVAPVRRTAAVLKLKFKDLNFRTRRKAINIYGAGGKTAGCPNKASTPLDAIESKLIQSIGKESVKRIAGGVDTFRATLDAFRASRIGIPSTSTVISDDETVDVDGTVIKPPSSPPPPDLPSHEQGNQDCEIEKTTELQRTNDLLEEFIGEFRSFSSKTSSFMEEFLNIEKLKLELLNESIELKRKKLELLK